MQVTNEYGDIKCIHTNGTIAWFSPFMVSNGAKALKDNGYTVFEALDELKPTIITQEIKDKIAEDVDKFLNQFPPIDDFTKAQIVEQLTAYKEIHPEFTFNPADKKEVLYNLYINLNK